MANSVDIRHIVSYTAKVVAPRLTQGQVDFHFQYNWGTIKVATINDLVLQLQNLQGEIDRLGEVEWADQYPGKRDPLRVNEIPLGNKQKMDWEW